MSFLNSVLSSIGGGAGQSQSQTGRAAPTQTPAAKPAQAPRVDGSRNGVASTTAPKRKAEGEAASVPTKAARKDPDSVRSAPVSRTGTSSPVVRPAGSSTPNLIPYRGTAQPSGSAVAARKVAPAGSSAAKPVASVAPAKPAAKPSPAPAATATASASASGPAPKKGSYQEILARAKAAQQAKPPVGAIKHKPVEKLSKKERLALEEKNKQMATKDPRSVPKAPQAKGVDAKAAEPAKEKKKAPDLGYQGTMRPKAKEPAYQGTMNRGSAVRKPGLDRGGSYDRSRSTSLGAKPSGKSRYSYYDDEEDLEDEEDYNSEGSSDMEAGIFDVDQEEELSLRAARKEDEEALRQEEELKRRKLERKTMLEKMNAQAKKKKAY